MSSEWSIDGRLIAQWLSDCDQSTREEVVAALELLSRIGPHLGRPLVDRIQGSRLHNLKELRPGSSGRATVRILFAFAPNRVAVLLVAGDKAGQWSRWYRQAIPEAERRFEHYLLRGGVKNE